MNGGALSALFDRKPPTAWERFQSCSYEFLARALHHRRRLPVVSAPVNPISVVCISDTHNTQPMVPDGDVLIHAGDLTQSGSFAELQAALDWLAALPHQHKVVVAGNHDLVLDPACVTLDAKRRAELDWRSIIYLEDTEVELRCGGGRMIKVFGSPWTPRHGNWAFQYPRTRDLWTGKVPNGTDVLITHGPPMAHLDLNNLGCRFLLGELWTVRPRLHVFGHIHAGHGKEHVAFDGLQRTFENIVAAKGGFWDVFSMLVQFILAWVSPLTTPRPTTMLVNAAAVGGLRDTVQREAIVVVL